jgi:hypothetical protein
MNDDLADVRERVRAAYQAVAATTVLVADEPTRPRAGESPPPRPRRELILVGAIALSLLIVGGVVALISLDTHRSTTLIATVPSTAFAQIAPTDIPTSSEAPATTRAMTCGSQLPLQLDIPDGYSGPAAMATSDPGQLALMWTSGTNRIEARWPADVENRVPPPPYLINPRGQQLGWGMTSSDTRQGIDGNYYQRMRILVPVLTDCHTLQVDIVGIDPSSVDAVKAKMTDGGTKAPIFSPAQPLVIASEERPAEPTVGHCENPTTPNRAGTVTGGNYPTATDALEAFLARDPVTLKTNYLEIRLPDRSIAYANESSYQPGVFLALIHVVPSDSGWSVDRWEIVGC